MIPDEPDVDRYDNATGIVDGETRFQQSAARLLKSPSDGISVYEGASAKMIGNALKRVK